MTALGLLPRTIALAALSSLERVTGIEPALSAWEADVLPLNYTRVLLHRHDLTISLGRVRADIVPEPIGCEGAPLRS